MRLRQTVACLLFFVPVIVLPQIKGKIFDAETRQALAGVNILLKGTFTGTATDKYGVFHFNITKPGRITFLLSMVGYERKEYPVTYSGGLLEIEIPLRPAAIQTEQVIVTAGRREQDLREVPVSIATITSVDLNTHLTESLDEIIRHVPGIHMVDDQVNIRGSSGYSRGVGSRVMLLLDGIPYLTGDTGEISWETIPVHEIEKVEVVKGAGSALYGSSALGGVINIITREPKDLQTFRFRTYAGIYDHPRHDEWKWAGQERTFGGVLFSFSGPIGPVRSIISLNRNMDDSYRENDTYSRWGLYSKFGIDLTESTTLSLTGNILHRNRGNFYWWRSGREAIRPALAQMNNRVVSTRGNISASFKTIYDEEFYTIARLQWYANSWSDDSSGRINNSSVSHVFSGDLQGTLILGSKSLLIGGVAANFDLVRSDIFGDHPGGGAALYAQHEYTVSEAISLTSGVRFDAQKVSALEAAARVSPKLGITYSPDPLTTFRGSVGSGFRYPSISELFIGVSTGVTTLSLVPNPNIKPEYSVSLEMGVSRIVGSTSFLDVAFFHTDYDQLIEAGVDVKSGAIRFDNIMKARVQGMEVGFRQWGLLEIFRLETGYTYLWARDLKLNEPLRFRPRHLVHASVTADLSPLTMVARYRFSSRVEAFDMNFIRLAPVINGEMRVKIHIVDIAASYAITNLGFPLRMSLNLNNLMNYHYVEIMGVLGPVRNGTFSVETVF